MREILLFAAAVAAGIAVLYHAMLIVDAMGWIVYRYLKKHGWIR